MSPPFCSPPVFSSHLLGSAVDSPGHAGFIFDDCFHSELQALALCRLLSNLRAPNFGSLHRSLQLLALFPVLWGCPGRKRKAQQCLKREVVAALPGLAGVARQRGGEKEGNKAGPAEPCCTRCCVLPLASSAARMRPSPARSSPAFCCLVAAGFCCLPAVVSELEKQ